LDKRDLFKEGAIALEALSETTNGDADSVVMNSACQSSNFFEAQPTALHASTDHATGDHFQQPWSVSAGLRWQ
jgi:hypothetical protein